MADPYPYQLETFVELHRLAPRIKDTAVTLGIDSVFLASVIAEEHDDHRNKSWGSVALDTVQSGLTYFENHEDIKDSYEQVQTKGDRFWDSDPYWKNVPEAEKFVKGPYPTLRDVGVGNIKLQTAIGVVNDIAAANGEDPFDLARRYADDYARLARDLISTDLGVDIAAYVVREAEDWFETTLGEDQWQQMSLGERAALISTYYNLGRPEIQTRWEESTDSGRLPYTPGVDTTDSESVDYNTPQITGILYPKNGLVDAVNDPRGENNPNNWNKPVPQSGKGRDDDRESFFDRMRAKQEADRKAAAEKGQETSDPIDLGNGRSAIHNKDTGVTTTYDSNTGSSRTHSNGNGNTGGYGMQMPILLDLDGDGVQVTELSDSTIFTDAGGDGLKHKTAWAGVLKAVVKPNDNLASGSTRISQ